MGLALVPVHKLYNDLSCWARIISLWWCVTYVYTLVKNKSGCSIYYCHYSLSLRSNDKMMVAFVFVFCKQGSYPNVVHHTESRPSHFLLLLSSYSFIEPTAWCVLSTAIGVSDRDNVQKDCWPSLAANFHAAKKVREIWVHRWFFPLISGMRKIYGCAQKKKRWFLWSHHEEGASVINRQKQGPVSPIIHQSTI